MPCLPVQQRRRLIRSALQVYRFEAREGIAIEVRVQPFAHRLDVCPVQLCPFINGAPAEVFCLSLEALYILGKFLVESSTTVVVAEGDELVYELSRCGSCVNIKKLTRNSTLHIPASITVDLSIVLAREFARIITLRNLEID